MNSLDTTILTKYGHTNYSVCIHTHDGETFDADLNVGGTTVNVGTGYADEATAYAAVTQWVIDNT